MFDTGNVSPLFWCTTAGSMRMLSCQTESSSSVEEEFLILCERSVHSIENLVNLRNLRLDLLLKLSITHQSIRERELREQEERNVLFEDLGQFSVFLPHSDVQEDQRELQTRLEDLAYGPGGVELSGNLMLKEGTLRQCLAKYLLNTSVKLKCTFEQSQAGTFDTSSGIMWLETEPSGTWEISRSLGSGASGVGSTEFMGIFCAKKEFHSQAYEVDLLLQLSEAMLSLHDRCVAHRDLKPQNVLVSLTSPTHFEYHCVKVADFGMSKTKVSESNTLSNKMYILDCEIREFNMGKWEEMIQHFDPNLQTSTQQLQQELAILYKLRYLWIVLNMVGLSVGSKELGRHSVTSFRDALVEGMRRKMERHMAYSLHSKRVMHDLGYVLVKLGDFGAAKAAYFGSSKLERGVYKLAGTSLYRAPELRHGLKTADWSKKPGLMATDIYSFGMVCYEIVTGVNPVSYTLPAGGLFGMGGIGKTTLCKILRNEEQGKFLKHLCDEDLKENVVVKRLKRLVRKVLLGLKVLKAFNVFRYGGSGSAANVAQPSKALTSPSSFQHNWTEILGGPQMPESVFGVRLCILNDDEPARKRIRTRNWSAEEIPAMLELTEEALRVDVGPDWDYVSENLWEQYGFDRASNSCENMWGTLLQSYRAIRDHESQNRAFTEFDLECREIIERILTAKPLEGTRSIQMNADLPSSALPLCQFQSSASDMGHFGSADCDEVMYDELPDSEIDAQSEDEGLSGDSTATVESQAEVIANSHVPQTKQSDKNCYETNSTYSSRKRSAATDDEDDLIAKIAPFVNKQIEDALEPLISVLRSREEDEQKHREKMLAIEEVKLALKREKMLFTRRVLVNSNAFRASPTQVHQELKLGKGFV